MNVDQRLFIYGTLAPGQVNHHVMQDIPGKWLPASVRGQLIEAGWGAVMGCPGILLSGDGAVVNGQLFESDALPGHWPMLDDFEGEGYCRVIATVSLADGARVEAYVYELSEKGRGDAK